MQDTVVVSTSKVTAPLAFDLESDEARRAEIAERLALLGVRKLDFRGTLEPEGKRDFRLEAVLGATVVQACVVTGEPVVTRIDEPVSRRYLADMKEPEGDEVEMPEDDSLEPLPTEIDLEHVMEEALSLALPDFPRAEGVEAVDVTVTEPGVDPMTDEDAKPFAGLKGLRDKLAKDKDG